MPIDRRDFLKTASLAAPGLLAGVRPSASQRPGVRIGEASYRPVRDYPIQAKRYADVTLRDAFWQPKVALNASVTIPIEVRKYVEGEREFGGNILEAAIMSLATRPDAALQPMVDAQIRAMAGRPARGNAGFEAAATYYAVTGKRDLLDRAVASADALYKEFAATNPPFSGGERDALNCIQLYRATGDRRHLDLAKHYLDIRGLPTSVNRSRHNQSYMPVLDQREAVGHAVNGATLMLSMADVGVLTGLREYFTAAERMWTDAVTRKMYITGGVGTTGNEGFGAPYALPNISAYAETCAVLMFMTLSHHLFLATGDARYIDVMERGMYNNALSGVSSTGDRFFYVNRLASAGDGRDARWERASLECCPPNLVRFLASMPGLVYAQGPGGVMFLNLYVSSDVTFTVNGRSIGLAVESDMPWGGRSAIGIRTTGDVRGALKLRIPGWARQEPLPGGLYAYADKGTGVSALTVNGKPVAATTDRLGYVTLDRLWQNGDAVELRLPIEARRVVTDARVRDNRGRIAIERGPIVYCAEWPDIADGKALDLLADTSRDLTTTVDKTLGGGVTVLRTDTRSLTKPAAPSRPVTMVPYYLWANRGIGEMSVWLPTREFAPGDIGLAGGGIFYVNPNHAADGWRYLEAAPFDQSAGATWGCFRTAIPGARGTAIGTGRQNTLDIMAACPDPGSAAALCATLRVNGVTGWFLPSRDELVLMYRNLRATGAMDFGDRAVPDNFSYWASSQLTADMAAHIDFADLGRPHFDDKDFPRRVRAIRAF